ncbi:MAG: NADH-quinone oxidoreductase subunit NuoN [Methyloligellaceae bacterium]
MENLNAILTTYAPLAPEFIVTIGALTLLVFGAFRERSGEFICWIAMMVMAGACFALITGFGAEVKEPLFSKALVVNEFTSAMKLFILIGSIVSILLSLHYMKAARLLQPELPVLILFATLGMMLMVSANDLISLYMGLELQSLALYVLAAIRRDAVRSSEAGLKYFVLGALSSGLLLYGASFIYGVTQTTNFAEINAALHVIQQQGVESVKIQLIFGLVFLLAGLAFKISAVPFHMWTPDVYEGSPTPITAFFASAPKIAAMALLVRTMMVAFPSATQHWQQIIIFLSIASMAFGAFAAIGQNNIKRLMAYSSIGHMGYALVGLAPSSSEGIGAVILYMGIYLITSLGVFACILGMRRSEGMVESIDELSGLARNNLPMAFILAMLLLSLAGIPPMAGFIAKFFVFSAAVKNELYLLAVIGVLSSVVAAYYYLRIIIIMFVQDPVEKFEPLPGSIKFVAGLSGLFVLCYIAYPAPFVSFATETAAKLASG